MTGCTRQQGAVLVVALVVLLVLTLTGVLALNRATLQQKMASLFDSSSMAFNAAEVAIEGVVFEQEDVTLNVTLRVLSVAQNQPPYNPEVDKMSCYDSNWTERHVNQTGLSSGTLHTRSGYLQSEPEVTAWSKVAYVGEGGGAPSGWGFNQGVHYFQIRGCGHVAGSRTTTANQQQVYIIGPKAE